MTWTDHLAATLGTRDWCVTARLTERLRAKGYTIAITPRRYAQLRTQWETSHPAILAIGPHPQRDWLVTAARRSLDWIPS